MHKPNKERLALAWCNLNDGQWDDLFGDKPEGFDSLTPAERKRIIGPVFTELASLLKPDYLSCFWHVEYRKDMDWGQWFFRRAEEKNGHLYESTRIRPRKRRRFLLIATIATIAALLAILFALLVRTR